MIPQHIDSTPKYEFKKIILNTNERIISNKSEKLLTFFIHQGNAIVTIKLKNDKTKIIELTSMEGFVITSEILFTLEAKSNIVAYQVKYTLDDNKDIIEKYDHDKTIEEIPIKGYKIIKNPKKVNKPWGSELWILWTKNHYVLKQLRMNAGFRTSLQFHRKKLESIYIHSGEADVISGFKIDPDEADYKIKSCVNEINFDTYKSRFRDGDSWHLAPGNIHRIIAVKDFISYEVSTPELDDVVRISDDFGRDSGRINSEHQ